MNADSDQADAPAARTVLVGIFAGGRGSRMGGFNKAELLAPDTGEPLRSRLVRIAAELGLDAVIAGGPSVPGRLVLEDDPKDIGPLGGLGALLAHAGDRPVVALACDLPYVQPVLLARLAHEPSPAAVLAPRDPETGKWHALFARYDPVRVRPALRAVTARGERSFQALLRELDVAELSLDDAEHAQLRDWDHPGDMT
jgi:molybdenum cofactor guanylyltransferase